LLLFDPPPDGAGAAPPLPIPLACPAARVCVFAGRAGSAAEALSAPPPPLPSGLHASLVEAVPGEGLFFCAGGRALRLGDSPQEVVAELGDPDAVYRPPDAGTGGAGTGGCWFNYRARGVDVLFSGGGAPVARKVVLHANALHCPDFGLYDRCNFRLHVGTGWSLAGARGGEPAPPPELQLADAWPALPLERIELEQLQPPPAYTEAAFPAQEGKSAAGEGTAPLADAPPPLAGPRSYPVYHTLHPAQAPQEMAREEQEGGASLLCNMFSNLMGDAFAETEGEEAPAPASRRASKPPLPPPPPSTPAARHAATSLLQGARPGACAPAPAASFLPPPPPPPPVSPGAAAFSPGPAARLAARSRGGPGSASGSSSSADLAAREARLETGSGYCDGWSDADELSALVEAEVEAAAPWAAPSSVSDEEEERAGPRGATAAAGMQTEAEAGGAGWGRGGGWLGGCEAQGSGSPHSFVSVTPEPSFAGGGLLELFEAVPQLRTCATQTPRQPPAAAAAAAAAAGPLDRRAAAGRAAAGAAEGAGAVITVLDDLGAIAAAYGAPSKPAMHPRCGGGGAAGGPATQLHGYPGAVFEVLPDGSIATLTLFAIPAPSDSAAAAPG
jgi:hypothetical protein